MQRMPLPFVLVLSTFATNSLAEDLVFGIDPLLSSVQSVSILNPFRCALLRKVGCLEFVSFQAIRYA